MVQAATVHSSQGGLSPTLHHTQGYGQQTGQGLQFFGETMALRGGRVCRLIKSSSQFAHGIHCAEPESTCKHAHTVTEYHDD